MDFVQFIPLILVLALGYYFIVRPLIARSKRAQSEGKNVIQSIPYTRFILVGLFLIAASYFFGNYVANEMVRDANSLEHVRMAAQTKYYSWGVFFLGVLVVLFGAIKALLDRPEQNKTSE